MDKKEIIIRGVKTGCTFVGAYVTGKAIGYNLSKLFHTMRIRKEKRTVALLQRKVLESLTEDELYRFVEDEDPDGSLRRGFLANKKSKGATEEEIFEMEEILFRGYKASRES